MLSGDFIRQFKLSPHQQKFYCYTSSSNQSIYNVANHSSPENIFEILSMLKEIELSLFEEYLNCIGNAFAVSQDRLMITQLYTICSLKLKVIASPHMVTHKKRELRGSLKELKHLKKIMCGDVPCYDRSVAIVEKTSIFQLCSTYMDNSDDNFDLNDFLGISVEVIYIIIITYLIRLGFWLLIGFQHHLFESVLKPLISETLFIHIGKTKSSNPFGPQVYGLLLPLILFIGVLRFFDNSYFCRRQWLTINRSLEWLKWLGYFQNCHLKVYHWEKLWRSSYFV